MAVNYVTNFKNNSGTVTLRCTWHFTNEVINQTYYSYNDDGFAVKEASANSQIITDITIICEGTNGIDFSETFYANDSTHTDLENYILTFGYKPAFPNVTGHGDAYSQVDSLYIPKEITWLNCDISGHFYIRNLYVLGQLEYVEKLYPFESVNMDISKIKILGEGTFSRLPVFSLTNTFDSLEVIKSYAFSECKMSDLRPYKLYPSKTIEGNAFNSCKELIYFNENNTIDCDLSLDNSSGYYRIFNHCPKIELLTFTLNATYNGIRSEDAEFSYFGSIIYYEIALGGASKVNSEGFQVVTINTENFIFMPLRYVVDEVGFDYYKFSMNYKGGNIEAGSYELGEEFLNIIVDNKKIILRAFKDGQLKIVFGDVTKNLRVLETTDKKASPVRIVLNNKIKALSY